MFREDSGGGKRTHRERKRMNRKRKISHGSKKICFLLVVSADVMPGSGTASLVHEGRHPCFRGQNKKLKGFWRSTESSKTS